MFVEIEETKKEDEMKRICMDFSQNYLLIVQLIDNKLLFLLKILQTQQQTSTIFKLQLSEQTLPQQVKAVFEDIPSLFQICFSNMHQPKHQNYVVKDNGVIVIHYQITFLNKILQKSIFLHLVSSPLLSTDFERVLNFSQNKIQCLKNQNLMLKNNFDLLKRKLKEFNQTIIIPLEFQTQERNFENMPLRGRNFIVRGNRIRNMFPENQLIEFCIDFVDENNYQFEVKLIASSAYMNIGVMIKDESKTMPIGSICCNERGVMLLNREEWKKVQKFNNFIGIKVEKEKEEGTVKFIIQNGTNTWHYTQKLSQCMEKIKGEKFSIVPFVELMKKDDEVQINIC